MPRRDGTGPLGQGPMSGLGLGRCVSEAREVIGRREGVAGAALRAGGLGLGLARRLGPGGRSFGGGAGLGFGRRSGGRLSRWFGA